MNIIFVIGIVIQTLAVIGAAYCLVRMSSSYTVREHEGLWVPWGFDENGNYSGYKCSVCGEVIGLTAKRNRCPCCKAKMSDV